MKIETMTIGELDKELEYKKIQKMFNQKLLGSIVFNAPYKNMFDYSVLNSNIKGSQISMNKDIQCESFKDYVELEMHLLQSKFNAPKHLIKNLSDREVEILKELYHTFGSILIYINHSKSFKK